MRKEEIKRFGELEVRRKERFEKELGTVSRVC